MRVMQGYLAESDPREIAERQPAEVLRRAQNGGPGHPVTQVLYDCGHDELLEGHRNPRMTPDSKCPQCQLRADIVDIRGRLKKLNDQQADRFDRKTGIHPEDQE